MSDVSKKWTPSNWASKVPFGIGETRPNNYMELVRTLKKNWHNRDYAWRILRDGVCDGCALGTTGMKDWTLDGIHLCNIRLRLLELNTMPALDESVFEDCDSLSSMKGDELRALGRIPYPMVRKKGAPGFSRVTWDQALDLIAGKIRNTDPTRIGAFMTSRGIPNESYYCVQKAMRAIGTNNIDNAARVCHSPSTVALKASIGAGATTCSYKDWLTADVIMFFGSNVANNQPVSTKYIHYAKKNGAKILVVNPYKEPGMERYWIPSIPESALFGTKIADAFYTLNHGTDITFINGIIKSMFEHDWIDSEFVDNHTLGVEELESRLNTITWESIESETGLTRNEIEECASLLGNAKRAVFVWSMGITQHEFGVDNVRAIVNLALTKGFVGRDGCGLMPIRGHSGVQGGAEMGAYSTAFPGGLPINAETASTLSEQWGFPVPDEPGIMTADMLDAAHEGEMDVLLSIGGNFMEVLPDPNYVEACISRIPLRVHMDIVLTRQMFIDPAETVILLPAMTRYEIPGGVTQTSTERRIAFSPEIPGPRIGEARSEGDVFLELARRVKPDLLDKLTFETTADVRAEIATVVPFYDGIQHLQKKGDQFQYGGRHLCEDWNFGTSDRKAHFSVVESRNIVIPDGYFAVSTRRGKQFNSIIQENRDAITGATRNAVLMNAEDIDELDLKQGETVTLENDFGNYTASVYAAPIAKQNLQVHWPEGNVLIDHTCRSPQSGIPDFNALVRITKK